MARHTHTRRGRLRLDPAYARKLVRIAVNPTVHPMRRFDVIHKLVNAPRQVAPLLADALGDPDDHDVRALARVTATKLGPDAVEPLLDLLETEKENEADPGGASRACLMRENVVLVLGDIEPPDERALAPLAGAASDERESPVVRKYARRSIRKIEAGLAAKRGE